MSFHSLPFAALFLAFFALYWLVAPWRVPRLWLLLLASVGFYAAWNPTPLVLFLFSSAVNWLAGLVMDKAGPRDGVRRATLFLAVCLHLGVLVTYKYLQLFLDSFSLLVEKAGGTYDAPKLGLAHPLGLSFLSFQAIGFVVDVYRRQTKGTRSPLHHLLFGLFFPRVVSGPILRASDLLEKLDARPSLTSEAGAVALFRITQGLAKKLLLADPLGGALVNPVFANPTGYTALECVLAAFGYTLQLYFDFSGYSDIAIGIAGLLGFKFPENFAKPYHATNLFEFWNRWHLTLSTWLRDYLYRPLGGNRGTKWQTIRNTMIVMSLGGLWHGGDWRFLVWGALHGVFLVLWRTWWWVGGKPKQDQVGWLRKAGGWLVMINAVVFARIFFRADTMTLALDMFHQLGTLTTDLARVSTLAWGSLAACIVFYALPTPVFDRSQQLFVRTPVLVRAVLLISLGLAARQFSSIESQPYIYLQY